MEVALEEFFQLTVSKTVKEVYLTDMYPVQVLVQQAFLKKYSLKPSDEESLLFKETEAFSDAYALLHP